MATLSYDDLVQMLTLQEANLATYETAVGATAGDITAVGNDLAAMTMIEPYADLVDAFKKTIFGIKQAVFNGDPSDPVTLLPTLDAPDVVVGGLHPGCLSRAQDRNRRFKAAPGYTHEIGVALGIESSSGTVPPIDPATVKPSIEATAAQSGYLFSVVVSNRADSDMWQVIAGPVGDPQTVIASATGKSTDVTFDPGTATGPVQLQVRVQLRQNNANYGQPSDIINVTVNP